MNLRVSDWINNQLRQLFYAGLRESLSAKPPVKVKNPRRVEGGKKAAETRRRNKEIAAALEKWEAYCAERGLDPKELESGVTL